MIFFSQMSDGVWANKLNYPATEQQIALPESIDCVVLTDKEGFSSCRLTLVHPSGNSNHRGKTEGCRHFSEFPPLKVEAQLFTHVPNAATQHVHKHAFSWSVCYPKMSFSGCRGSLEVLEWNS